MSKKPRYAPELSRKPAAPEYVSTEMYVDGSAARILWTKVVNSDCEYCTAPVLGSVHWLLLLS